MYLVIIEMTLDFSGLVMSEAVLTYIGVGVEPGTGSWGRMILSADRELPNGIWWNLAGASILLFLLVLAFNLFADSLRDALDPRLRKDDMEEVLKIEDLRTYFYTDEGVARAVDGVSLSVGKKQTLGLVGESGCGKSMTALSVLRLVPSPPGRIAGGRITLAGEEILSLLRSEDARHPGQARIHDIPGAHDEPQPGLHHREPGRGGGAPPHGNDPHRMHKRSPSNTWRRSASRLPMNGCPSIPHQLSGGMKQRVMIAMALCLKPALLIADEPTTALDVTIQAGILRLMKDMQEETEAAILLITHDLGVIAEMADEVAVMYAGKIVETGPSNAIFASFLHPYTEGLFKSLPGRTPRGQKLYTIAGNVPSALQFQTHAAGSTPAAPSRSRGAGIEEPPLVVVRPDHRCACWVRAGEGPP